MLARLIQDRHEWALLLVRLSMGLIFVIYGWNHVSGLEGYTNAFANQFNIPLPEIMAPLAAYAELIGGVAVLLGILTRYAGIVLAVIMVVSTVTVQLPQGLAEGNDFLGLTGFWDLDLTLFIMGVTLMLAGPGSLALERGLFGREL